METRANYVLIGTFMLAMVAGIVALIVWTAKVQIDQEYDFYVIYFDTAVTGLPDSGDVRYNGINVGTVREISLREGNPDQVRVMIRVFEGTPVDGSTVARLEVLGLTGVSFVQLTPDRERDKTAALQKPENEPYPLIPSEEGSLQNIVSSAPELFDQGTRLIIQGQKLLSDRNIENVSSIIAHVEQVTGTIAEERETIRMAVRDAQEAIGRFNRIAREIEQVAQNDLQPTVQDVRAAAESFASLSASLERMVKDNEAAIGQFTATALPDLSQFAVEARRFAATLNRIAEKFERNPRDFLFSDQRPEIEANP